MIERFLECTWFNITKIVCGFSDIIIKGLLVSYTSPLILSLTRYKCMFHLLRSKESLFRNFFRLSGCTIITDRSSAVLLLWFILTAIVFPFPVSL